MPYRVNIAVLLFFVDKSDVGLMNGIGMASGLQVVAIVIKEGEAGGKK